MWPESTMDQHWPCLTTAVWLILRVGKVTQKQTQEHTATVQWSRVVRSWAQGQARCRQVSTKLIRDVPWSSPPPRLTVQRASEKQDSQCLSLQYYHVPSLLLSSTLNCTPLMQHCRVLTRGHHHPVHMFAYFPRRLLSDSLQSWVWITCWPTNILT